MLGFCEPLNENWRPFGMEGLNYCFHFHTASAVEPIARFVSLERSYHDPNGTQEPPYLQQYYDAIETVLNDYWGEWLGNTYEIPAETMAHNGIPYEYYFNGSASIGISYLYMFDFDRDTKYLGRAIVMAEYLRDQFYESNGYCVWKYNPIGDRVEDANHALQDLKYAILMHERGFVFNQETLYSMMTTWFDLGLEGTDCLTCRIDGSCPGCTETSLESVCPRSLFLMRYIQSRFEQCIGVKPFEPCNPTGCNHPIACSGCK